MSTDSNLNPAERIEHRILFVRGQKVLVDRDLAEIHDVETRTLNQAVRRNIDRFPEDFMFALNREKILRISQTVTSSGQAELKYSRSVPAQTREIGFHTNLSERLSKPKARSRAKISP